MKNTMNRTESLRKPHFNPKNPCQKLETLNVNLAKKALILTIPKKITNDLKPGNKITLREI